MPRKDFLIRLNYLLLWIMYSRIYRAKRKRQIRSSEVSTRQLQPELLKIAFKRMYSTPQDISQNDFILSLISNLYFSKRN